jgi:hypothetical protein
MADEGESTPHDPEPDRPRRRRPRRDDRDEPVRSKAGVYVLAALGAGLLLFGVSSLPRVLSRFGNEDPAHVLGRLAFVAIECLVGIALIIPLIRSSTRADSNPPRPRDEDEGW